MEIFTPVSGFSVSGRAPGPLFSVSGRTPSTLFSVSGRTPVHLLLVSGRTPDVIKCVDETTCKIEQFETLINIICKHYNGSED